MDNVTFAGKTQDRVMTRKAASLATGRKSEATDHSPTWRTPGKLLEAYLSYIWSLKIFTHFVLTLLFLLLFSNLISYIFFFFLLHSFYPQKFFRQSKIQHE